MKRMLEEAEEGTQVIEFTNKELDQTENELSQAAAYSRNPHQKLADWHDHIQAAFGW